jgi:hypothetical protein
MPHQKFARYRKTNDEKIGDVGINKSKVERGEKKPRYEVAQAQAD